MVTEADWRPITKADPPVGEPVLTRIDDGHGPPRNEAVLKRGPGKLWFFPDGSMYVYYTPTHFKPAPKAERTGYRDGTGLSYRVDYAHV